MEKTYTESEVVTMLLAILMFSNANNNQGLTKIKGNNFGEQIETIKEASELSQGSSYTLLQNLKRN